jgi:hypothetical protein
MSTASSGSRESKGAAPDPAGRLIADVRTIRNEIAGRVDDLVVHRVDEIRADKTSHELRLEKVLSSLIGEFEGMRTPLEIRECLRAGHCYELESAG